MADTNPTDGNDSATPNIAVPSHTPLPPPPDISYTRPPRPGGAAPTARSVETRAEGARAEPEPGGPNTATTLGGGLAAATTFVASVVAGFLIGQWIDHRWNHTGTLWGTLIFSLLGVAAGFLNLFRVLSATDRKRGRK